jgi:hypothetical protein
VAVQDFEVGPAPAKRARLEVAGGEAEAGPSAAVPEGKEESAEEIMLRTVRENELQVGCCFGVCVRGMCE